MNQPRWILATTGAAALIVMTAATGAAQKRSSAVRDVTGTWTMSVEAPPPHGNMQASMTLTQDGTKVTGRFEPGHGGEFSVNGDFADGTLRLTMSGQDGQETTFTAKARDDGTLAGYVSGPMGDMKWTAERVEKK